MEILGLAIVVVLVLIATTFVVRFVVLNGPTDYRKGFVSSELASNIINTLLKTSAKECSQLSMTELLQDCSQQTGLVCSNGENSCKYVNSTAKEVFAKTFDKWKMNYEFLAYTENEKPFISLGKPCKAEKKSKLYPVPTRTNTMYIRLDIC